MHAAQRCRRPPGQDALPGGSPDSELATPQRPGTCAQEDSDFFPVQDFRQFRRLRLRCEIAGQLAVAALVFMQTRPPKAAFHVVFFAILFIGNHATARVFATAPR